MEHTQFSLLCFYLESTNIDIHICVQKLLKRKNLIFPEQKINQDQTKTRLSLPPINFSFPQQTNKQKINSKLTGNKDFQNSGSVFGASAIPVAQEINIIRDHTRYAKEIYTYS